MDVPKYHVLFVLVQQCGVRVFRRRDVAEKARRALFRARRCIGEQFTHSATHCWTGIGSEIPNQSSDTVRPACKKCGYPGHFTYQCRNFLKVNPNKDIVLDVSSTSSEEESDGEFVSPLTQLNLAQQRAAAVVAASSSAGVAAVAPKKERESRKKSAGHKKKRKKHKSRSESPSARREESRERKRRGEGSTKHEKRDPEKKRHKHSHKKHKSRERSRSRS